jgi:hypothetical protein
LIFPETQNPKRSHFSLVPFVTQNSSARNSLYPPYIKAETLSELWVLCQEILTKKSPFSQETLIKTLLPQKQPSIKQEKRDLVLMKRTPSALALMLALLLLTSATAQVVNRVNANFVAQATTPPPPGAKPPQITVFSPENQSEPQLSINVVSATLPLTYASTFSLPTVYYKGDWMANESVVDSGTSLSLPLNNVSIGIHTVIIRAVQGCYYSSGSGVYYFRIENSTLVKFKIENTLISKTAILLEQGPDPTAFLPLIMIKSDGSITPQTEFIKQDGNVYTLTADLTQKYAIKIQRSNIVFDGAGHIVSGYGYPNKGLSVESVTNVTVKDIEVRGFLDTDVSIESTTKSAFLTVKAITFFLENSNFNTVAESNINSSYDFSLFLIVDSNNNTITRNNFANTVDVGNGFSNTFFENNFARNKDILSGKANFWDNGSIGNYWSEYNGTDANGDGIGDTPHVINSFAQDRFPLMNPWDPEIPYDTVPPRISIVSPENKVYNASSVLLTFLIYEAFSSMSYSLDGQDNVTIAGNTTLSGLPNGSYNLTVYVTDLAGNTGASETIYFNVDVPEPFPTLLVATASGVSITGVAVCAFYYRKKRNY